VWVKLPEGLDAASMLPRAVTARVAYVAGTAFYVDGQGRDHMRLSYCYPTPERIREGVRRLAGVVSRTCSAQSTTSGTALQPSWICTVPPPPIAVHAAGHIRIDLGRPGDCGALFAHPARAAGASLRPLPPLPPLGCTGCMPNEPPAAEAPPAVPPAPLPAVGPRMPPGETSLAQPDAGHRASHTRKPTDPTHALPRWHPSTLPHVA
jgi:hypothetical protein